MRMRLAAVLLATSAGAAGAVSFPQADLNHDGVVTYNEARRVFPRLTEIQFKKNDPSGDGMIEPNEFPLLANFYWMIWQMPD